MTPHAERPAPRSSLWRTLVTENPMLIEMERFRRRFLSMGGGKALNATVIALLAVCYAGLLMLVLNMRGDMPPMPLLFLQTGLFVLIAPNLLHSSIAGEREKRTWDLLLVAPITKAQIVVGKFFGALAALGVGAALFAVPLLIAAVTYDSPYDGVNYWDLLLAQGVSLSFAVLVCAFTIFVSARVKRGFMALGVTLGALFVGLVVAPGLMSVLVSSTGGGGAMDMLLFLHPMWVLTRMFAGQDGNSSLMFFPSSLYGGIHILLYLAFAAGFLVWAERTLHFAENEVRFLPQGHKDA